ncbi:sugar ABC transporter substrate-binding protein [Mesotoga sp. Brook.08.YT.4.2.5.1]|nr:MULTISPECIES: maltose ABC transporter substrate-binding protein [unclassified Mesotoga]RAM58551.1 sugar ABC transporter substrate-binding protein [Mesotoga sp. SC_4PWL113PWK15]RAM60153.1 sugar ABC transporter substrate-binding protein [Mesotoga sp. SC_4PWA21]PNE23417.1 sugar ABC transporter substrate-binding protein [Mesotoga sp. Brook.08.YT.4.2.5.1]PNS39914.1 sugar ABC transporter substrate-binding protein [Mesotoga sp. B105.6.4]PVD16132.1 sugar ABC transporter substrate-binding protein [M
MRKLAAVLLVLLLVLSFASAKLVIWSSENQIPALEKLAADFESDYGIQVEIQQVNFGDIKSKFLTAAPAGEGPDIIVGAHDWVGELAINGLIEPIPFLPEADQYYDVTLDAFSYGGNLYGVPYTVEAIAIIYNKDLVFKAPKTISELEELAFEAADDEVVGLIYAVGDFYHSAPFILGRGGYIFKETAAGLDVTDIGLNNEGAIAGGNLIKSWFDKGLIPGGPNYNLMDSLFKDGLAAFIINGIWATPSYRDAGIDYAILPFSEITFDDGTTPRPFVGVQGFMINSKSPNKLEATEFVVNYIGSFEGQYGMFLGERRGTARADVFAFIEADAGPELYDVLQFSKSASVGTPMPNVPEMASVWGAMGDALGLIINGQDTVENAFNSAVEKIKTTIGK